MLEKVKLNGRDILRTFVVCSEISTSKIRIFLVAYMLKI